MLQQEYLCRRILLHGSDIWLLDTLSLQLLSPIVSLNCFFRLLQIEVLVFGAHLDTMTFTLGSL